VGAFQQATLYNTVIVSSLFNIGKQRYHVYLIVGRHPQMTQYNTMIHYIPCCLLLNKDEITVLHSSFFGKHHLIPRSTLCPLQRMIYVLCKSRKCEESYERFNCQFSAEFCFSICERNDCNNAFTIFACRETIVPFALVQALS